MAESGRGVFGAPVARVAAAAVMALVMTSCGSTTAAGEFTGTRLDPPFEVSSVALTDTEGDAYSLTEDTDRDLTLVFFGYTHCPDICGQVMSTLAGSMKRLDDEDRKRVGVVFVTTDPTRDTEAVVDGYVDSYDPTFIGLTGALDDIEPVAASVKVAIGYFDGEGKELSADELPRTYDVEHGTQVFGIDAEDEVTTFWRSDVSQAQLTSDVLQLLDEG